MDLAFESLRELVREWARNHPEIEEIYLFGSRAKGTNRPDSDADLAMHADQNPNWSGATTVHFEMEKWQSELTELLGVPADVEELTDKSVSMFVKESSRLVYQRGVNHKNE